MKKGAFLLLTACLAATFANAQVAYSFLNQNNISALFSADGQLFWNGKKAAFEAPKGSGNHTISAAGLWIGGLDKNNALHISAQTYRETGADFWPGPLDSNGTTNSATSSLYNTVWKVTRLEIDSFLAGLSIPLSIKNWPGNGMSSGGYASRLAPFVDVNNDGIYNPSSGDYPDIKGDVMLWWVYNDKLIHTQTKGKPLGVEIQASAYAYNCSTDPILNNSIFLHYSIINRSGQAYDSVYAGLWTDFDIGNPFNDYVGCDSSTNTFYGYNSDSIDNDTTMVSAVKDTIFYKGYGKNLPLQSVSFLDGFFNNKGVPLPMSKFMYFLNDDDSTAQRHPRTQNEYYNYLAGRWATGAPLTVGGSGYGGSASANYAFPGNPRDASQWSEQSAANKKADRSAIGSYGPVNMNPGEIKQLTATFTFQHSASGKTAKDIPLMYSNVVTLEDLYKKNALSPCSGISICTNGDSCVWPGDANDDHIAEGADIFNIGYAFAATGPKRLAASNAFVGQHASTWNENFPDGENYRFADCNGDGVVDSSDVLAIMFNYGETHNKKDNGNLSPSASDPLLLLNVIEDSVPLGGIIHIQVKLGDASIPANGVLGAAFDLNYNPVLTDTDGFLADISHGWLGKSGDVLGVIKNSHSNGKTHAGITTRLKRVASDTGVIGTFKYVVSDNISGGFKPTKAIFSVSNEKIVDGSLKLISVRVSGDSVKIYAPTTGIEEANALERSIHLYPNPANTELYVDFRNISPQLIRILDIYGREVQNIAPGADKNLRIDIGTLPQGMYFMQLQGHGSTVVKRFLINR